MKYSHWYILSDLGDSMGALEEYLIWCNLPSDVIRLICLVANEAESIRKAFLKNQTYCSGRNASGEQQAAMDTWADGYLIDLFSKSGLVRELASEEQNDLIQFSDAPGTIAVVMDPLDGSSLIQTNLAVGSILGIYADGNVFQKGRDLTAALYTLYGPMTVLVVSGGKGVRSFAFNPDIGEFVVLCYDIAIPEGSIYGTGGLRNEWIPEHTSVIRYSNDKGFKIRYSGSFVADVHQILIYGGFYSYPALKGKPDGKLRLLFEANPLGFIVTQAGGAISDGKNNPLDLTPQKIHQKTPIYIGSKGVIKAIEEIYAGK